MTDMKKYVLIILGLLLLLSGCTSMLQQDDFYSDLSASEESASFVLSNQETESTQSVLSVQPETVIAEGPNTHPYIAGLIAAIAEEIITPEMSEYEKTKAAFDYVITHVSMGEPIGLELWRVHGGGAEPLPFVEQRAISPLRFGVGMCEDYAAALTVLLRGMDLEAEYVPGLTYSAEGHLVDHAWTMVKIDGTWYHLDSQLEDNISRHGSVRYRYFLKGDATLAGSHRWGQNLVDSRLLAEEQNQEIQENYLLPAAPQDYPTPERLPIGNPVSPDHAALEREAADEIAVWEIENGPLPKMKLNTIPPVFGLDGYGPADKG